MASDSGATQLLICEKLSLAILDGMFFAKCTHESSKLCEFISHKNETNNVHGSVTNMKYVYIKNLECTLTTSTFLGLLKVAVNWSDHSGRPKGSTDNQWPNPIFKHTVVFYFWEHIELSI